MGASVAGKVGNPPGLTTDYLLPLAPMLKQVSHLEGNAGPGGGK